MVLSRIWSAFIIIAIAVASIKYFSSENYSQIFNDMVVGKGGDTIQVDKKPIQAFSPEVKTGLTKDLKFEEADRITVHNMQYPLISEYVKAI